MEGESSERANNAGEAAPAATPPNRSRAKPDCFLITCRCFGFITALAALLCIVVNVLSAIRSFRNRSDIFDGIFRCYAVVVAVLVVVAETEWELVMKFSKVLEYWVARGILQIFVAVMTRAYPEYKRDRPELFLLQSIASYLLIACGAIYVILGVLCIGALKRARQKARQKKELSRGQALDGLEDLERRREDLECLLVPDRV